MTREDLDTKLLLLGFKRAKITLDGWATQNPTMPGEPGWRYYGRSFFDYTTIAPQRENSYGYRYYDARKVLEHQTAESVLKLAIARINRQKES